MDETKINEYWERFIALPQIEEMREFLTWAGSQSPSVRFLLMLAFIGPPEYREVALKVCKKTEAEMMYRYEMGEMSPQEAAEYEQMMDEILKRLPKKNQPET